MLGDHIRKVRLDRGLLQKEVATQLGGTVVNVFNWERNRVQPRVGWYPAIVNWLGYCPIQYAQNIGELIRLHRTHQGLSAKRFAKKYRIDECTVLAWETMRKDCMREKRSRKIVKSVVGDSYFLKK